MVIDTQVDPYLQFCIPRRLRISWFARTCASALTYVSALMVHFLVFLALIASSSSP